MHTKKSQETFSTHREIITISEIGNYSNTNTHTQCIKYLKSIRDKLVQRNTL